VIALQSNSTVEVVVGSGAVPAIPVEVVVWLTASSVDGSAVVVEVAALVEAGAALVVVVGASVVVVDGPADVVGPGVVVVGAGLVVGIFSVKQYWQKYVFLELAPCLFVQNPSFNCVSPKPFIEVPIETHSSPTPL
jgi:hypothetical protein